MAKSKKQDNTEAKEDLVMDVMPGADAVSEEDAKPFEVDLNFEEDAPKEEAENEEVEQEVDAAPEEEARPRAVRRPAVTRPMLEARRHRNAAVLDASDLGGAHRGHQRGLVPAALVGPPPAQVLRHRHARSTPS